MGNGKSEFTGIRRIKRHPILLAALALALFTAGAALGWSLLGAPQQRFDSREVIFSQPMQIWHSQMHSRMAGTVLPTEEEGKYPNAVIPVRFYNFGSVKPTETVSRDFVIENRGSVPLKISSSYTTCGCTTAELSASIIPAGKSALVTVTFDGRRSEVGTKVLRGVIFETNDPQHPQLEIWVQASVTE